MWTPPQRLKYALKDEHWPSVEDAQQARLFKPYHYQALALHQRTWVPAMVPWRSNEKGEVTEAVLRWYKRFAEGQPGAIVIEATGIRDIPSGPLLRIGHDRYLPGLSRLVETVRKASRGQTKLFIQLIDFLTIRRRPKASSYFQRFFTPKEGHRIALVEHTQDVQWLGKDDEEVRSFLESASKETLHTILSPREYRDVMYGYRDEVNDLHLDSIRTLPETLPTLFAQAAHRAKEAGFDGVELHYAHAYTMASFLSTTNLRTDGYGGSLEGRIRLPLEVYQAVRQEVGDQYVVGCRMLADEVIEGGSRVDITREYALRLAQAGMDFLSLSKGGRFEDALQPKVGQTAYPYTGQSGYECMPSVYSDDRGPFGRNRDLAKQIRTYLREHQCHTPVIVAGGIGTFSLAERLLKEEYADIIAAARQSLADPDWFLKIKHGQGSEIRRCQYTNYCEALDARHKQVTCRLWDRIDLKESDVLKSHDGRRRLEAPKYLKI